MNEERPHRGFLSSKSRGFELFVHALLLLALLPLAIPGVFFHGETVVPGDILLLCPPWSHYAPPDFERPNNRLMVDIVSAFMPYYAITNASLQAGDWPLWNPLERLGMPLLANMQSAVFYPPRLLHYFFGLNFGQNLYVLLKLWLCGMTAFLCARAMGLSSWISRFFSIAWMFASYNLIWANWSLPDVAAWLPIAFLGVEFTLQSQYRKGLFATALGGSLMLIAGHPETAFAMGVSLAFYFLFRLAFERRWGKRFLLPVATQAGAWLLVVLLCASMLLPFLEYLTNSYTFFHRGSGEPKFILEIGSLVTAWVPQFFGTYGEKNYWGSASFNSNLFGMVYPGMAVWLAMTLLLAQGDERRFHRARLVCLGGAALLSLLVAYDAPAVAWINRLPFFRSMLVTYHTAGTMFLLPLLAAFGLVNWFSRARKPRELVWMLLVIVPAVSIVAFAYRFNINLLRTLHMDVYVQTKIAYAALFAALAFIPIALHVLWPRPRILCFAVTAVLAADLLTINYGLNPTLDPKYVYPETKLTSALQELEQPTRIGTGEGNIPSGFVTVYGLEELLGYDGLYPARIIQLTETVNQQQWQAVLPALSVEYYLNDPRFEPLFPLNEQPDRYTLMGMHDGVQIYRDHRAMPRAFLLSETYVVSGFDQYMSLAKEPEFDVTRIAYLESPLPEPLPPASGASAGEARVVSRTHTHVAVDVNAQKKSVLVLSDAYFPGWRATVDGESVPIFPVDHVLRGIVVDAGQHRVEYTYFPTSLKLGLGLSIATCIGSLVGIYLTRRRGSDAAPAA